MVAFVFTKGLHRHQVAARARFRITLTPANFATGDLAHIMDLLFFGAEFQQGRAKHPDAEAVERRAAAKLGHFLTQYFCFLRGKTRAAICLGPIGYRVALRDAALEPQFLRFGLENKIASAPADVFVTFGRCAHFGGAVFLQPGARFGAECF